MEFIKFEWDTKKTKSNHEKHGISFEEARSVFHDEHAMQFYDPDHSTTEDRFIMLGISYKVNTLVVCHCYRKDENKIRIISARKADKDETNIYWSNQT